MSKTIKQQHDAFGAYGQFNDWGLNADNVKPSVEIFVNGANGRERGYVSLSLKEAEQAIEIIKDAIKEAEREAKTVAKRNKKRRGGQRF